MKKFMLSSALFVVMLIANASTGWGACTDNAPECNSAPGSEPCTWRCNIDIDTGHCIKETSPGEYSPYCDSDCKCQKTQPSVCGDGKVTGTEECDVDVGAADYGVRVAEECNSAVSRVKTLLVSLGQGQLKGDEPLLSCIKCKCSWCGDGIFTGGGADASGGLEQCSDTGIEGIVDLRPMVFSMRDSTPPAVTCAAGQTCSKCSCKSAETTCGDGKWDSNTEPCDDSVVLPSRGPELKMCFGHPEQCKGCECKTCGDGVFNPQLDPAQPAFEQCDAEGIVGDAFETQAEAQANADLKCDEGQTCSSTCACVAKNVPVETPALKTCTLKISGAQDDSAKGVLDELNARVHEILGTESIDLFGEQGYSVATVSITFPDTAAAKDMTLASGMKVIVADDAQLGPWALIQIGGTPPYDYRAATFKPVIAAVTSPMVVFPVGLEDSGKAKAQSLGLKEVVFPDLSSAAGLSGVTFTDVVSVLGSENVTYDAATSSTSMRVNDSMQWSVKSAAPLAKTAGTSGVGATLQQGEIRMPWDGPSWTGVEGGPSDNEKLYVENRQLDVTTVLAKLETLAAERKAAGRPIDCDIMIGLPYEPNLNMQFIAVQNKVAAGGGTDSQGFGALAIMTDAAQGAGGCKCAMSAAAPEASNLMLIISMALGGLGALIAARKRKR